MAVAILLVPPAPSFSDLVASRPDSLPEAPQLSFFLPPEQRTLTEWVRLLRSQPDPELHAGDPVRISGFVLERPGETPEIGPPHGALLPRGCHTGRDSHPLA